MTAGIRSVVLAMMAAVVGASCFGDTPVSRSPSASRSASASASRAAATATANPTSASPSGSAPNETGSAPATTPTPSAPGGIAFFDTLPPGSSLPNDVECTAKIAHNAWEPRADNATANRTNVYAQGFRFQSSYFSTYGPALGARVTGNFTGTTDEILRWGACKWGFDENTVRAQAVIESYWHQSTLGDCGVTTQPETKGCASVGILQVKGADIPPTHPGTWPAARTSTAFNVDYTLAIRRLCYEGKETWLHDFNSSYGAGDLWGCIGRWFSGRWHDAPSEQYIQRVKATLAAKTWITF